jgi:hypothetical protein
MVTLNTNTVNTVMWKYKIKMIKEFTSKVCRKMSIDGRKVNSVRRRLKRNSSFIVLLSLL